MDQLSFQDVAGNNPSKNVSKERSLPPMLRQYLEYKQSYPEHAVLFQVGDFYEVFFEDAEAVAQALSIRLTSRDKNSEQPIPMCGVPLHAIGTYLPRLLAAGFSCVLVDQVEASSAAKGMVKRGVRRIVTPGTRFEEDGLDESRYNFLASVLLVQNGNGAVCYGDVSAGLIRMEEVESAEALFEVISRVAPAELVIPSRLDKQTGIAKLPWVRALLNLASELGTHVVKRPFESKLPGELVATLEQRTTLTEALKGSFQAISPEAASASLALLSYLDEVSFDHQFGINRFQLKEHAGATVIDAASRRNLELFETRIDGERRNSLFQHLDRTKTSMGARLFSDWLADPSVSLKEIESRQDAVEVLVEDVAARECIATVLSGVRDLERLATRVASGRANPSDLKRLEHSLEQLPELQSAIQAQTKGRLRDIAIDFDPLADIYARISAALVEEPPAKISEGGIFREGYSAELDSLRSLASDSRGALLELEQKERKQTGISSLKVKFNNVHGYFIEVTKMHKSKVPERFERKQTLTNAERYVTSEVKELERAVLSAKSRMQELEQELFRTLRESLLPHTDRLYRLGETLAEVDTLCSFAVVAAERDYVRPEMTTDNVIEIKAGRHPVIERLIGPHNFVANGTRLEVESHRFAILTGPNMGGKSTYLRQVGVIQLLAQIGSFVPAASARLGVVDRIFTRIGTADDITRGDSTFMVEMREASTIARRATTRSLVLIDEIGRGTATADGLALAQAIAEWLHDFVDAKVIFATHFHELTTLEQVKDRMFCIAVGVVEDQDSISFTHHIEERVADRSYGLEVAKLTGLPKQLLERAQHLLDESNQALGRQLSLAPDTMIGEEKAESPYERLLRSIAEQLRSVDLQRTTPLEALTLLSKLREMLDSDTV